MTARILQKDEAIRIAKVTQSARGEECHMQHPEHCNHNPETTVWCHSNEQEDGKGMGRKAHDVFGFYGCTGCHYFYDKSPASREEKRDWFHRAFKRSLKTLIKRGILK